MHQGRMDTGKERDIRDYLLSSRALALCNAAMSHVHVPCRMCNTACSHMAHAPVVTTL